MNRYERDDVLGRIEFQTPADPDVFENQIGMFGLDCDECVPCHIDGAQGVLSAGYVYSEGGKSD